MTKKAVHPTTPQKPPMPFVSVCTPTFNRRPFIPTMFECFRNQRYPKHRLEWIIIDDGTDKIKDLVDESKIPQIKYFPVDHKMTLGAKRNMMHEKAKGSIIVYMDDDDYYPPERIAHAVDVLQSNPRALCAGSSEIYLYFKQIRKMYQFGPYNPNHATAATFAFRRELLNITRYEDTACLAEEKHFLKEYTIPFVQLDPMKTILVFSHEHNSFDKRRLLENPHPQFVKESPKTVDMFIRTAAEAPIKKFFMEDIDALLAKYAPGEPAMKQDVLTQMKQIDEDRQKMQAQMQAQQQNGGAGAGIQPQIMMQEPGKPPVAIGIVDAVNIINRQQQQLQLYERQIKDLQDQLIARPASPPKTVSFGGTSEEILLAKGKAAVSEVAKLKERIQELEAQVRKSAAAAAENTSATNTTEKVSNQGRSKLDPEVRIPLASQSNSNATIVNPTPKSNPHSTIVEPPRPPVPAPAPPSVVAEKSKLEPEFRLPIRA